MKHSNLMILILAAASIIFFGCSKEDPVTPDLNQSDQETNSLKAEKIQFYGTCNFALPGDPGTTTVLPNGNIKITGQTGTWYDEAFYEESGLPCSVVTGLSDWTVNWLITGENTAKVWGKTEIRVGTHPDHPEWEQTGLWVMSWHGWQTPTPEGFIVVCDVVGQGKEGDVKGMVAKWTYTMDSDVGFFYATEGSFH